ncbi:MAG: formylglycine-generating enzyme family protein [Candidatus Magnetomorum sp.]|nr:formylglycine-generating enzyme family protein [Candidatus Magnetomorum sp.]
MMKKKFFISLYIFWVSVLVYIFFRLIHPAVPENTGIVKAPIVSPQFFDTWTEPITNIEFVRLPKGCFQMGSPRHELDRGDDESPVHSVCLDSFWISKMEITVFQFQRFIKETGYQTQAETEGFSWGYDGHWKKRSGYHWKNPGFSQTKQHPVVHVSYQDAMVMARFLSGLQRQFSLPTEAQWEFACRANTEQSRFFGDDIQKTCEYANIADQTIQQTYRAWTVHPCNDTFAFTAPVASLKPNGFGLFDTLGNVWEWCLEPYDHQAYFHPKRSMRVTDDRTPVVIRGGSWYSRPKFVRCANRDYVASIARRSSDLGFRLVMHLRD